jgi:hypothetical protein
MGIDNAEENTGGIDEGGFHLHSHLEDPRGVEIHPHLHHLFHHRGHWAIQLALIAQTYLILVRLRKEVIPLTQNVR